MKNITIGIFIFLLSSCSDNITKLNIVVTYNNGDIDTFYGVDTKDSVVCLEKGDLIVFPPGFETQKTVASNVRKYNLIK